MRYQNISGGSLLLPLENGRGGSINIPKDQYFEGSSMYQKYVTGGFIRRVGVGAKYPPVQGDDPTVIVIGKHLLVNGLTAESIDSAVYSDVGVVVEDTAYTVFGKVYWYDGDGDLVDSVDFSIIGNGTHGSGATFAFGSSSASTKPTVTGSSIDVRDGTISVEFDNGAPEGEVVVEGSFDYEYAGEHLHYGDIGEAVFNVPNTKTKTTYVLPSDVSSDAANYANGSAGQIKSIKTFARGAQVGDRAKINTFRYRDTSNPTSYSNIDVTDGVVVADDLL